MGGVLLLDMSRLSLAEWCLVFGGGGGYNCITHQKWRRSDSLPTVSRAFGICQRVCPTLLSCVLPYCAPTFSSDILSFVAFVIHMTNRLLRPLGAFCSGHQLETIVECLSWSVIVDVIPYKCQQLFPQTGSGFICYLLYLPVPLNFMCVRLHCTFWLTCCVYYDSRPDSPHITISPSGWHRQRGRQWEGRGLRHGIFDQRLAQSSRKLLQLATQIHRWIIILMAWH